MLVRQERWVDCVVSRELWGDEGLGLAQKRRITSCLTSRIGRHAQHILLFSSPDANADEGSEEVRRVGGEVLWVVICFSLIRNEADGILF